MYLEGVLPNFLSLSPPASASPCPSSASPCPCSSLSKMAEISVSSSSSLLLLLLMRACRGGTKSLREGEGKVVCVWGVE